MAPDSDFDDNLEEGERPATSATPDEVLRGIAAGETLDHGRLRALSTPSDGVVASMLSLWGRLAPERRRELLATLHHLAEDDPTLDFHRIHLSALRDPDPATRILAVRGLWEQDREDYMRLLLDQLRGDPEASVRAAVAEALGQFVIGMEFGLLSEEAADDLGGALREAVEDINEVEEVRAASLTALGASSQDWVAELISEQYETGGSRMRVASLLAMGRNADEQWLGVLVHNFADEEPEVRAAAATATGQLLMEEAIDPLLILVDDEEEEVQVAAIHALGEIAGEGAERVLTDLMGRSETHVREAAREALAEAQVVGLSFTDDEEPSSNGR